jgi:cardiolipin synthase (CMP-forming)
MNSGRSNKTINVPNLLTLVRLLLTPLFIILLIRSQLKPALVVFFLAGISDGLDGLIARWLDQRTILGAYLDPIADKVLLMSSYICLGVLGIIPAWVAVVILSRDILIVIGIAILTLTEKKYRIRPSGISKCTTLFQLVTVIVALMATGTDQLQSIQNLLLWTTAVLTTISGLHYIFIGMNILQQTED